MNCHSGSATSLAEQAAYLEALSAHGAEIQAGVALGLDVSGYFCDRTDGSGPVVIVTGLDPQVFGEALAQRAFASLTVEVPAVETAPPADAVLLVGVRAWFWVGNDEPVSATATIPGLAATVTATAGSTTFTFDDGTTLTCDDGGAPYVDGVPGRDQPQGCTHVFQDRGERAVQATTTWTLAWTATNGTTGTLPDLVRTTDLTVPVRSAEAVTD